MRTRSHPLSERWTLSGRMLQKHGMNFIHSKMNKFNPFSVGGSFFRMLGTGFILLDARYCTHMICFIANEFKDWFFLQKKREKELGGDYMRLFSLLFKLNYYKNNIKHLRLVLALNKSFITYHQMHVNFLFLFLFFFQFNWLWAHFIT